MEAFESEFGLFSLKRRWSFSAFFSKQGGQSPSLLCVLAPWGQNCPNCHPGADLVSVEGPLVILPFKKYVLIKLYWKGGWQELVEFSFQHIGTDWKGNLLNKNLQNIYPLEVMRIYLLNTWSFFSQLSYLPPSQVCFSTWAEITYFEFLIK